MTLIVIPGLPPVLTNREIEQAARREYDAVLTEYRASGYTEGRALHEAAIHYDRTEASLMRERSRMLRGEGTS
jgi:hypothetical protein